jgi:hypothetical protein
MKRFPNARSGTTQKRGNMARRVQIGAASGQTPKKVTEYRRDDPSSYVPLATPSRQQMMGTTAANLKSSLRSMTDDDNNGRPKTSRGSRNPPPDDFFSYVVPSPNRDFETSRLQVHSSNDDRRGATAPSSSSTTTPQHYVLTEKDVYIGCWLFGSLLRV